MPFPFLPHKFNVSIVCQLQVTSYHFFRSTLSSSSPLEYVYSNVWGFTQISSINTFTYYIIFIDNFSKYVWLYPIKHKYDVYNIFPLFKSLVENQLNTKIKTLYSNNGGEYLKLQSFLKAKTSSPCWNCLLSLTPSIFTSQILVLCSPNHSLPY